MKIGILTFHCADNYGAVLQTYALQETLKKRGFEVDIIDYKPLHLTEPYKICYLEFSKLSGLRRMLSVCKNIILIPLRFSVAAIKKPKVSKSFRSFRAKRLNVSPLKFDRKSLSDTNYDIYVFGSDQIWNTSLTNMDTAYFGDFKVKSGAKKISYAASMSHFKFPEDIKNKIAGYLNQFSALGVRELEVKKFLNETCNLDSTVVLDPTLILEESEWDKIAVKPRNEKYILIYALGMRDELVQKAKMLAKANNTKVITIGSAGGMLTFSDLQLTMCTPEEFVGLFKYASYILTSSFHGTAFSLIFKKQFYVMGRGNDKDTRISTLLDSVGLKHRMFFSGDKIDVNNIIDYNSVDPKFDYIRTNSLGFIDKYII